MISSEFSEDSFELGQLGVCKTGFAEENFNQALSTKDNTDLESSKLSGKLGGSDLYLSCCPQKHFRPALLENPVIRSAVLYKIFISGMYI